MEDSPTTLPACPFTTQPRRMGLPVRNSGHWPDNMVPPPLGPEPVSWLKREKKALKAEHQQETTPNGHLSSARDALVLAHHGWGLRFVWTLGTPNTSTSHLALEIADLHMTTCPTRGQSQSHHHRSALLPHETIGDHANTLYHSSSRGACPTCSQHINLPCFHAWSSTCPAQLAWFRQDLRTADFCMGLCVATRTELSIFLL